MTKFTCSLNIVGCVIITRLSQNDQKCADRQQPGEASAGPVLHRHADRCPKANAPESTWFLSSFINGVVSGMSMECQ